MALIDDAFSISVKGNVDEAIRWLSGPERRRVEVAAQRALIQTAREVSTAEQAEMRRVFDQPTRFTLGAIRVKPESNMSVSVGVVDGYWSRADNYLYSQIAGGARRDKAFERALQRAGVLPAGWRAVPGRRAKLDAYGNQSVGEIKQILSWFGAAVPYAGSTQNMTDATRAKRRKGTKKKLGFELFVAYPGERVGRGAWSQGRRQNLKPGIYRRTFFGFGTAIEPLMMFVPSVRYRPRFDFLGVATRVVSDRYGALFDAALGRGNPVPP